GIPRRIRPLFLTPRAGGVRKGFRALRNPKRSARGRRRGRRLFENRIAKRARVERENRARAKEQRLRSCAPRRERVRPLARRRVAPSSGRRRAPIGRERALARRAWAAVGLEVLLFFG